MEDACALIAKDKRKAAEIYNAVAKVKQPVDETMKILNDANTKFSVVPDGTMRYAEFMARVGTIKAKPAQLEGLFLPGDLRYGRKLTSVTGSARAHRWAGRSRVGLSSLNNS